MPAQRIGNDAVDLALYDVIGFDSPQQPECLGHIALVARASSVSHSESTRIRLTHMIPPFREDALWGLGNACGSAELNDQETRLIGAFVLQIQSELDAEAQRRRLTNTWNDSEKHRFRVDQYTICPSVRRPDEHRPYHQFSCAGFVHEAYSEAGISLVNAHESSLPECSMESLRFTYADMSSQLDDAAFRADKGLEGEGPWPIMLPGYILNSMRRSREDILSNAYDAQAGDEYFPSRPPIPGS